MKRRLPEWLLNATSATLTDNSPKRISSGQNVLNESGNSSNDNEHSDQTNCKSDQIQNNQKISVVPLANLLSPSICADSINISNQNVHINKEMDDDTGSTQTEEINAPITSNTSVKQEPVVVKQEIKDEPVDPVDTLTPTPVTVVPKVEDVKPERQSCNYGIKCFRQNAAHRREMAHPGDADYRRPNFPAAVPGTPLCPWGASCYRRNPQHFIQLSHPPATNTTAVLVNHVPQTNNPRQPRRNNTNNHRNSRRVVDNDADDSDIESDLEDPFLDDGSSDEYIPNEDEDDDDDIQDNEDTT